MKIIIIYTHVLGKTEPDAPPPETYAPAARRFFETYQQFKPSIPHETVIINCNRSSWDSLSGSISVAYTAYFGGGWDCGAFQCAGQTLDCDLLVCMNAYVHFWRVGWLEPFVKAAEQFGPGLYGAMASYQSFPHLRTPCMCCHPKVLREYPVLVNKDDFHAWFDHFRFVFLHQFYPFIEPDARPMNDEIPVLPLPWAWERT